MKNTINYLTIAILVSHLACCKKLGLLTNDGKTIITERNTIPFNKIILKDNINLIITQDSVDKIKVEAGENVQKGILTKFNANVLDISNADAAILSKPGQLINVYAFVKNLDAISYQGSGNVNSTNTLTSAYFSIISNSGAGNVRLSLNAIMTTVGIYNESADFILEGHSDSCYNYCSSRGTIDYRNFNVDNLEIDYSSVRDAYVNASNSLTGNIFYKGNLFYKGNPSVINVKERNEGKLYQYH